MPLQWGVISIQQSSRSPVLLDIILTIHHNVFVLCWLLLKQLDLSFLHQINLLWHLCVMQNSVEWLSAQQDGRSFQAFNIELKTKTTHAHTLLNFRFVQSLEENFEVTSCRSKYGTWFGYKGRHSRTPLRPSVLLWAGWSGTSWECAYQCGRPYECTDPFHLVHLCKAYSQGSPHRYLPRNSLLCSFSVKNNTTEVSLFFMPAL